MTETIRGEKYRDTYLARIPLGRWSTPEEVAPPVCFLLSSAIFVRTELPRVMVAEVRRRSPLPQPHARLLPVRELDPGGFERRADGGEIIDCRHSSALLEVPDRTLAEIRARAQFGLRPVHQAACRARLFGRNRHSFSFTRNVFR